MYNNDKITPKRYFWSNHKKKIEPGTVVYDNDKITPRDTFDPKIQKKRRENNAVK